MLATPTDVPVTCELLSVRRILCATVECGTDVLMNEPPGLGREGVRAVSGRGLVFAVLRNKQAQAMGMDVL